MRCSKVNKNLNAYFDVCLPKAVNSAPINDDVSINIIGYVGTDSLVFFRQSLKNLATVNGKTPAQMIIPKDFCQLYWKITLL